MQAKDVLKYIRFISLIRSFRRGEVTRREILIAVGLLVGLRLAIWGIVTILPLV
jgi:hypothetical protein